MNVFAQTELMIQILFGLIALLLLYAIVLSIQLGKMRKRYVQMLNGMDKQNIEDLVIEIQAKLNKLNAESHSHAQALHGIAEAMRSMKCKVGIHRYNAFAGHGSDLSFSIAILDDNKDGIVLTGIHSREDTYIYAKPVQKGQSSYTLSPEEIEAINRCS